jgi:hypothetical protein
MSVATNLSQSKQETQDVGIVGKDSPFIEVPGDRNATNHEILSTSPATTPKQEWETTANPTFNEMEVCNNEVQPTRNGYRPQQSATSQFFKMHVNSEGKMHFSCAEE